MTNSLAFFKKQILSLNTMLINSDIALDDYRLRAKALLLGMGWQKRIQLENLVFT